MKMSWSGQVGIKISTQDQNGGTSDRFWVGPFYVGATYELIPLLMGGGEEQMIKSETTPISGTCSFTPQMIPGVGGSTMFISVPLKRVPKFGLSIPTQAKKFSI
jgi:hypothetical protein